MPASWMLTAVAAALVAAAPLAAASEDMVSYDTTQSFDDVIFGLENAIIGQGLRVDGQAPLVDLAGAGAATRPVFRHAEVYALCSGLLAQKMLESDPMNLAFCPYSIFVMVRDDRPDVTTVGYRTLPAGPLQEVQALLDIIVRNAVGWDPLAPR